MGSVHLFLSPHYDDVVYSCGGTLWELAAQGHTPHIVTICGGDPPSQISDYAQSLHDRWGMPDHDQLMEMVALRRAEDREAAAICRAEVAHWDIPDCIYRADAAGDWLYEGDDAIFGQLQPGDRPLINALSGRLAQLVETIAPASIFVPLAIGHHVDHQIVRTAAEQALKKEYMVYYADYPYVRDPNTLIPYQKSEIWTTKPKYLLSASAVDARIAGMAAYRSQLSTFWSDQAELEAEIKASMANSGHIETFWSKIGPMA